MVRIIGYVLRLCVTRYGYCMEFNNTSIHEVYLTSTVTDDSVNPLP